MKNKTIILVFILSVFVCFFNNCAKDEPPAKPLIPSIGMYIENGLLMKDGKPYYGIGANYYNLFNRIVEENDYSGSSTDQLIKLARAGIPFVRFAACPYWPKGWTNSYFKDTAAYFKEFDKIVKIAEKYKIGLIPSLFWNTSTVPDLMGEHMDQYANENSKTIAFTKQYTRVVVNRYKKSPAIWAWEFGNEFANVIDIPYKNVPQCVPELGTPATRDPNRDYFTHDDMLTAFRAFGNAVREYDTIRPLFSGNTEPRASAWHNANDITTDDWTQDSESKYKQMVILYVGDPINTLTIRGYYNMGLSSNSYPLGLTSVNDFFAKMKQWSVELGKPLFVGEWGASSKWANPTDGYMQITDIRGAFMERLNAIVSNKIQISAFWVFDLDGAEDDTNVTFSNSRTYMLNEVIKANKVMEKF